MFSFSYNLGNNFPDFSGLHRGSAGHTCYLRVTGVHESWRRFIFNKKMQSASSVLSCPTAEYTQSSLLAALCVTVNQSLTCASSRSCVAFVQLIIRCTCFSKYTLTALKKPFLWILHFVMLSKRGASDAVATPNNSQDLCLFMSSKRHLERKELCLFWFWS